MSMMFVDHSHLADGVPRSGWVKRGIPNPESVGEHMRECARIGLELGAELGVDPEKLSSMLAIHDVAESDPSVGDIVPEIEGIISGDGVPRAEKFERERIAMRKICADLPDRDEVLALWEEFEAGETPLSVVAKQIDVFQMVLLAFRYHREHGMPIDDFLADAKRRITHPVLLRKLAEMA